MSLFNDALLEPTDTTNVQAGGLSFFDKAGATAVGATISGLGSIYNTFATVGNALGGTFDEVKTYNTLEDIDRNWAEYYKENQNAIDVGGFIASSLIPGTLAIKGLRAVQAGASANSFGRALGFARTKQAQALTNAVAEIAQEGGTVFTQINRNKLAAMGWGFADQTLTAAAFETGVALTMKQSPLLADDDWLSIAKSGLVNAAFGGIIGGGIDSLFMSRAFKDLLKGVDSKVRNFDYQAVYDKLNLSTGDKAWGLADSLLTLPAEVPAMAGFMKLPQYLAERTGNARVDFSGLFEKSLKAAEKSHLLEFETILRSLAKDPDVAAPTANFILKQFADLKNAGAPNAVIRERMGDYLFSLKGVRAADSEPLIAASDLWYFKKQLTPAEMANIKTLDDWEAAIKGTTPFEENAYSKPYVFLGTQAQREHAFSNLARISKEGDNGYPSLSAAWKDGRDVALMPDGTLRINDSSPLWRRVNDPVYGATRFLDTNSGAITERATLTATDKLPAGQAPKADVAGITFGEKRFQMGEFQPDGTTEYFTARHAWASQLKDKFIPETIDAGDFSLLDRLRSAAPEIKERTTIVGKLEGELPVSEIDLDTYVANAKVNTANKMFQDAYDSGQHLDLHAVAYQLNVQPQFLETIIGQEFKVAANQTKELDLLSRDLGEYLRREHVLVQYARPQQFAEIDTIPRKMSWRDKRLVIMDQVAMTGGQFVTGELAWRYRVTEAVRATRNAASAVLGTERVDKLLELTQDVAKMADSLGAGSGFLSSSNANYGELLRLWAQDTGKNVHLWIQQDTNAAMDALNTHVNLLRAKPSASAELGIVTNLLRGTDEKYMWHPTDPNTLVLREIGKIGNAQKFTEALAAATSAGRRATIKIDAEEVVNFLKAHQGLNSDRISKRTVLYNSRGTNVNLDPATVYVPPIDTTYFQHFAFVRPLEGKAFGTSEVSMVFGRDAAELNKRIAAVDRNNFDVITKDQTEKYFKAKGDYDFDLTINEPRINSELRRTGALSNTFAEVRGENLMEDYIRWHQNQAARLVRDSVETNYAQQIAELRKLGESYIEVSTSKFSGTLRRSKSEVFNPYDDFVKTALDISKRSEYTFFHQANEFVDALGTRAYRVVNDVFGDARKGIVSWTEANAIAERYGVGGMYSSEADFFTANVPRDRNLVREYVSKANMLLANFVLRFDFANSMLNVISTPLTLGTELASITTLAKKDAALVGKLSELTSVLSPAGQSVPSASKLVFNAVRNFFGENKDELLTRYKANGDIKDVLSQYHSMLDDLAMRPDFKNFTDRVDRAFEKVAGITGNNWAEQFTRFVSADVMRQLSDPLVEAGKLALREQNAYISTFVNRVQGNYISSQRPIVFQGVLGSAMGLFQTYTFNLLQQLLRHVENKDKRAVATLFGLQSGLFGLNGTPMFEAVNTHLIGNSSINQGHYDAYSMAPSLLGKEVGDWLLYGTASAFPAFGNKWPALYSRGDINPRHITILPVSPADVPAIDASTRLVSNLYDVGKKLVGGADITNTLLQGLEHNGINRPLAGVAQLLAGQSTTSRGGLISAASDFDLIMAGSRVLGAKPMDEAIALNNLYRLKAYQASDRDRMEFLGEKVKSYLYKQQMPPDDVMDGFMKDYAAAGGRLESFNGSLQHWMRDANRSTVEKMRAKMQTSYGQRLSEIMGGESLSDYYNITPDRELVTPE